jgi:hypothetical protein
MYTKTFMNNVLGSCVYFFQPKSEGDEHGKVDVEIEETHPRKIPRQQRRKKDSQNSSSQLHRALTSTSDAMAKGIEAIMQRQATAATAPATAATAPSTDDEDYLAAMQIYQNLKNCPPTQEKMLFRYELVGQSFKFRRQATAPLYAFASPQRSSPYQQQYFSPQQPASSSYQMYQSPSTYQMYPAASSTIQRQTTQQEWTPAIGLSSLNQGGQVESGENMFADTESASTSSAGRNN